MKLILKPRNQTQRKRKHKYMQRSYCGLVDVQSVDESLNVKGWVNTRRDHGGVIFIDLRDHTG